MYFIHPQFEAQAELQGMVLSINVHTYWQDVHGQYVIILLFRH